MFETGAPATFLLHAGDYLDSGVLAVDSGLVVRGWNRWLEARTGWKTDEAVGRPLLALFPSLEGSWAESAFQRALRGETVVLAHRFHQYLLPLRPDPAYSGFDHMQQSARIAPLLAAGGAAGAVALIQDVTERVARESELRVALETVERASRAKSEFIAAMSHELRTPLSAIIGYSDILEAEISGPLLEPQKEHMRRVKAGAWHLMGIIEEILTFSRADAGREVIHPEPIDAVSITMEALSMVEPQAEQKGLRVRVDRSDSAVAMTTDAGKLRQILVNLLGNAVKFTDAGEIAVGLTAGSETVTFKVRDTGPGIAPEHLARIFEPFTQVEAAIRVKGGTGLGLAVSQRLARILGGELQVASVPGEGSTFSLTLPRQAASDAGTAQERA